MSGYYTGDCVLTGSGEKFCSKYSLYDECHVIAKNCPKSYSNEIQVHYYIISELKKSEQWKQQFFNIKVG